MPDSTSTNYDIKIFGERNTGTHALRELIETNSASRCAPSVAREVDPGVQVRIKRLKYLGWVGFSKDAIGQRKEAVLDAAFEHSNALNSWKHCATQFDSVDALENMNVLFLVRHPASWILSLHKNPYHILPRPDCALADFIDLRWKTVRRERLGGKVLSALEIYNQKISSYRHLQSQLAASGITSKFIRFEDNILNQAGVYGAIRGLLLDPRKRHKPVERSTKASGKTLADYIDYYGREAWRSQFRGLEDRVNQHVDWNALRDFGYEPLK